MASHPSSNQPVAPALVAERAAGWHAFTSATKMTCVSVVVILLLMLVFLRIL